MNHESHAFLSHLASTDRDLAVLPAQVSAGNNNAPHCA